MYALIWRLLPGPTVVRVLLAVLLAVAVLAALWFLVFPWVDHRVSLNPSTIDGG